MSMVFISYRRDDVSGHASRVYKSLAEVYNSRQVFFDSDHISSADLWSSKIESAINKSLVFFCVIGPRWDSARLQDPNDYVRRELSVAQSRGKPIIPLIFDGARPPLADELPVDSRSLLERQWIFFDPYDFEAYEAKLRKLGSIVEGALEALVEMGDKDATCRLSLDIRNNKGKDTLWFRLSPPGNRIYVDVEHSLIHVIKFPVGLREIALEKYLPGNTRGMSGGLGKTITVASYDMFFEAGDYTAKVERYELPFPLNLYDRHKFYRPTRD